MRTHITIDIDIHKDLKVAAALAGLSIQKLASDILRRELRKAKAAQKSSRKTVKRQESSATNTVT